MTIVPFKISLIITTIYASIGIFVILTRLPELYSTLESAVYKLIFELVESFLFLILKHDA